PDREHRKPQPTTCYTVVCVKTAVEISEESLLYSSFPFSARQLLKRHSAELVGSRTLQDDEDYSARRSMRKATRTARWSARSSRSFSSRPIIARSGDHSRSKSARVFPARNLLGPLLVLRVERKIERS